MVSEPTAAAASFAYDFHVALDGSGINGLEGMAGVCCFRYDPVSNAYAWKIRYFDGVGAGHAVAVQPETGLGFLGNAGVARGSIECIAQGRLRELPCQRMLASAAADQKDIHGRRHAPA